MMVTVESIMALSPCYTRRQVRALVGEGLAPGAALRTVLLLPPYDARWILARLLPQAHRAAWARGCAERAKRYAAAASASASYASYASDASYFASYAASYSYASDAADYASYAADAAADADDAADAAEEHKLACVLALEMLSEVK